LENAVSFTNKGGFNSDVFGYSTVISKTPKQILGEIHQMLGQFCVRLEKIRLSQKIIQLPISNEEFVHLENEERDMKNTMKWCEKELNILVDTIILEPDEFNLLLQLKLELILEIKQLDIFIQELNSFRGENYIPR
jgi:hypothetical protein